MLTIFFTLNVSIHPNNRFSDRARYWSKIVIFHIPCIRRPRQGGSRRNIAIQFRMEELEWLGYQMVKKNSKISLFVLAQYTNVIDGQTDRHRVPAYTALMHSIAR